MEQGRKVGWKMGRESENVGRARRVGSRGGGENWVESTHGRGLLSRVVVWLRVLCCPWIAAGRVSTPSLAATPAAAAARGAPATAAAPAAPAAARRPPPPAPPPSRPTAGVCQTAAARPPPPRRRASCSQAQGEGRPRIRACRGMVTQGAVTRAPPHSVQSIQPPTRPPTWRHQPWPARCAGRVAWRGGRCRGGLGQRVGRG